MCVCLCLMIKFSKAQSAQSTSLQQIVAAAIQHSPQLKSGQALVNGAREDIQSVKNAYLPTAIIGDEATISSDNSIPGSYLSLGIIPLLLV